VSFTLGTDPAATFNFDLTIVMTATLTLTGAQGTYSCTLTIRDDGYFKLLQVVDLAFGAGLTPGCSFIATSNALKKQDFAASPPPMFNGIQSGAVVRSPTDGVVELIVNPAANYEGTQATIEVFVYKLVSRSSCHA
jgi:hypothetical protein